MDQLKKYKIDTTGEDEKQEILNSKNLKLTNKFNEIIDCDIFIITVPTLSIIEMSHIQKKIKFCRNLSLKIQKIYNSIGVNSLSWFL